MKRGKNLSCTLAFMVLFSAGFVWAGESSGLLSKANKSYKNQKFEEAILGYQELIRQNPQAGFYYYNLGNALFRTQQIGQAILAYERALMLEPRDRDIRDNLDFAANSLEYRVKDTRNWYLRAGEYVLSFFTLEEILILFHASYAILLLSWLFVLLLRRGLPWGWIRKTFFTVFLLASLLLGVKYVETHVIRDAIVMAKEAEVHYGPSDTDQVALRLGEGLKVYVIDHQEDWSRIWLVNGTGGWIRNDQIQEVRMKR